jgi:hypothetical protein
MALDGYYPPEREEEVINDIARFVVNNDFDTITHVVLESLKPIAGLGGPLVFMVTFPFFSMFGTWSLALGNMLQDNPREKIDKILQRIEEFKIAKEATQPVEEKAGWLSRLKKLFR